MRSHNYAVILDIDGTIYSNDGNWIGKQTLLDLADLIKNNVLVTFATARDLIGIRNFTRAINKYTFGNKMTYVEEDNFYVLQNGSLVSNLVGDKQFYNSITDEEDIKVLKQILQKCKEEKLNHVVGLEKVSTLSCIYNDTINTFVEKQYRIVDDNYIIKNLNNVLSITINTSGCKDKLLEFQRLFGDRFSITNCGNFYMTIVGKEINKWTGIKNFLLHQYPNLTLEKIVTIGDNENDIEMLSNCDNSFAMGNAKLSVQECAKVVTGSLEEMGVSQALRKTILKSYLSNSIDYKSIVKVI